MLILQWKSRTSVRTALPRELAPAGPGTPERYGAEAFGSVGGPRTKPAKGRSGRVLGHSRLARPSDSAVPLFPQIVILRCRLFALQGRDHILP